MKGLTRLPLCFLLMLTIYCSAVLAEEEEFNQTYDLAPGGTIGLKNINGPVTIKAWDRGQVEVKAIKKAKSREDLDQTTIEVDPQPSRINIRTVHPKSKTHDGVSVSYTLHVPRNVNLDKIESVNGSVTISDIDGSIDSHTVNGSINISNSSGSTSASTVNGGITVELNNVAGKDMKFKTVNGSIKAYLPESISADVTAKTTNGSIHTDFPLTVQGKFTGKTINGRLGNGGPVLSLETVNGSVGLMKRQTLRSGW